MPRGTPCLLASCSSYKRRVSPIQLPLGLPCSELSIWDSTLVSRAMGHRSLWGEDSMGMELLSLSFSHTATSAPSLKRPSRIVTRHGLPQLQSPRAWLHT